MISEILKDKFLDKIDNRIVDFISESVSEYKHGYLCIIEAVLTKEDGRIVILHNITDDVTTCRPIGGDIDKLDLKITNGDFLYVVTILERNSPQIIIEKKYTHKEIKRELLLDDITKTNPRGSESLG